MRQRLRWCGSAVTLVISNHTTGDLIAYLYHTNLDATHEISLRIRHVDNDKSLWTVFEVLDTNMWKNLNFQLQLTVSWWSGIWSCSFFLHWKQQDEEVLSDINFKIKPGGDYRANWFREIFCTGDTGLQELFAVWVVMMYASIMPRDPSNVSMVLLKEYVSFWNNSGEFFGETMPQKKRFMAKHAQARMTSLWKCDTV